MTGPIFTVIGDGQLSDEAIEALAALLLSVEEAEGDVDHCAITTIDRAESTSWSGGVPQPVDNRKTEDIA